MKKLYLMLLVLVLAFNTIYSQDVIVSGDITTNTTWTSDKTYLLVSIVRVQSGATLTIQPGTKIYGQNSSQGSLVVKPGGKIMAEGTQNNPIVFTSEFTKSGSTRQPTYGDWGGIIILGNAPINVPGGTAAIEGPGDSYGGTNPDDNSGVMKYVRIEYPGIAYSLNNEINGLTFGGVGRGTKIEYIQVSYSGDDSFEWFGGTVNCKYLIAYRGWDDDFDTDYGYNGKLQFLLSIRDPQIADQSQSNGFESDNDGAGSTNSPRTSPTYYNVTLIGPAATTTSNYNALFRRGMHLRRSSQNKIHNALIMGWPDGVLIDGVNTVADARSGVTFLKNSIISGSVSGHLKSTDATFQTEMPGWFTTNGGRTFTTNAEVLLADPFNIANPNPMPTIGSPVFTGGATPPSDGFFDATATYVGAFGYRDWTAGWSSFNIVVPAKPAEIIAGDITTDITLTRDKDYTLVGIVRVQNGGVLRIQSGTKIYGQNSSQGSLVVKPGGRIFAEGTRENPIVFTSEFTKSGSTRQPTYGDWGGIIILGNAPINVPGGTAAIEGPGDSYGGTNPDDNSGVMKYVRIEYPGIAYSLNNEINGLTFGGVGRGTTVEYIQVSYSGDDSFEWFGGTVNCKYLIAYRGWDDDFDTDYGYNGKLQFLLSIRDPQIADQSQSNGFESDNDGAGSTNSPRTSPTYYNVTLIGPAAATTSSYNALYRRGMHLRRSSQNKIHNALIMGWPDGVLIDGVNTVADAKAGVTFLKNSIISGSVSGHLKSTDATFQTEMPSWFTTNGGRTFTTNAEVGLVNPFHPTNPNPFPLPNSVVYTGGATPPNDGFFDPTATFIGAFGYSNWAAGWSSLEFISTSVKEDFESIPGVYHLSQNYPNPFNPTTNIKFIIPEAGNVKLSVYNVLGQEVAQLVKGYKDAGTYNITWNATNISSGIYFYRLESAGNVITKKMTLLR
ncbi:MAG: T9SS type A sorting domain-containing protein [Bacteroidota bacterium]